MSPAQLESQNNDTILWHQTNWFILHMVCPSNEAWFPDSWFVESRSKTRSCADCQVASPSSNCHKQEGSWQSTHLSHASYELASCLVCTTCSPQSTSRRLLLQYTKDWSATERSQLVSNWLLKLQCSMPVACVLNYKHRTCSMRLWSLLKGHSLYIDYSFRD
jgi:hypothetical protein